MGAKSEFKKAYIIQTATALFGERGFKDVTMKDIAEACQISRGGLYLYYADTAELFLDVLANEKNKMQTSIEEGMKDSSSALERLSLFLKFQKKEIFASQSNMTKPAYEFVFANENSRVIRDHLEERAKFLQRIIEDGVREGSMVCANPRAYATQMMIQLEGLRICVNTAMLTTTETDAAIMAMQRFLTQGDVAEAPAN